MINRPLVSLTALTAMTSIAAADTVISAPFPIVTMMTSQPSLVGALVMGAQGFGNWTPPAAQLPDLWKTTYLGSCQTNTTANRTNNTLVWPSGCDLGGMASTINQLVGPFGPHSQHWQVFTNDQFRGDLAEHQIIDGMRRWGTPSVIPIYGVWDHYATVSEVGTATVRGAELIRQVTFYDALPSGVRDANMKLTLGFVNKMMITDFLTAYSNILQAPGATCDLSKVCDQDPYNDPWYYRWVVIQEPPVRAGLMATPASEPLATSPAPALVAPGEMTASLAGQRVFAAVQRAGMATDPLVAKVLSLGTPDGAVLVHGLTPAKQPWNYYLVTVRDDHGLVTAFIQLSARDGALINIAMPSEAFAYQPVEQQRAEGVARTTLNSGEKLAGVDLVWVPGFRHEAVRAPYWPYYEFVINDSAGQASGVVRVARHDGTLLGRVKMETLQRQ